jgi:glutamate 5-kinase
MGLAGVGWAARTRFVSYLLFMNGMEQRRQLGEAKRVVIKIGTRALVRPTGRPDVRRMRELVRQIARLKKAGRDVVLVSSGAIGSGMEALGMKKRPTNVPDLQMAAAVGQSRLMATYDKLFAQRGCTIGQILLTHDDLKHRVRHVSARNTVMNLLRHGIVPIVNENDVVAVDEIKFGDNDLLASLVAMMIEAQALILLTTVDGLRAPAAGGKTKRVAWLKGISEETLGMAGGKGSELSTGGMLSKLQSASMVVASGISVVIANGRASKVIERVMAGADVGTFVSPGEMAGSLRAHRKRWIAFFHKTQGTLVVDDGARAAIEREGRSLLPVGIREVEGDFGEGSVVNVRALDGTIIARGLAGYSSDQIRKIKGRRTDEIAGLLGAKDDDVVIHRDSMELLTP